MKKILAFAGSNSSTSMNHALVAYGITLLKDCDVKFIRLTDYPLPMFGEDLEREEGYPDSLRELLSEFKWADAIFLSVNEHNRNVSAFFKNVLDWLSRLEYKFLEHKPIFLMSTSDGRLGARASRAYTEMVLPRFDGGEITTFELPSNAENFSDGMITNNVLDIELKEKVKNWLSEL